MIEARNKLAENSDKWRQHIACQRKKYFKLIGYDVSPFGVLG
jgi:hypothetical protein